MMCCDGMDVAGLAGAVRALRISLPMRVRFADADGDLRTLEGLVRYRKGDAIVTGVEGEEWPIPRTHFDTSYAPVPPLDHGAAGVYRHTPATVVAAHMDAPFSVLTGPDGSRLHGEAGDWLVQYDAARYGIVRHDLFLQLYEILPNDE